MGENSVRTIKGAESVTTNNRMELRAALEALKVLPVSTNVEVYTDSVYVQKGITEWIHRWKATAWRGGKIKNIDLWEELDKVTEERAVSWYWVKGHSGNTYNEMADGLARSAIVK